MIEEFIYLKLKEAGLKTSSNSDEILDTNFSIYNLLSLDPNYLGSSSVKTGTESAVFSFNCFGSTKGKAYAEVRAVTAAIESFPKISEDVTTSTVYDIQALPVLDGLHGYTVLATIVYFNTL
jgi:hypothetical protein